MRKNLKKRRILIRSSVIVALLVLTTFLGVKHSKKNVNSSKVESLASTEASADSIEENTKKEEKEKKLTESKKLEDTNNSTEQKKDNNKESLIKPKKVEEQKPSVSQNKKTSSQEIKKPIRADFSVIPNNNPHDLQVYVKPNKIQNNSPKTIVQNNSNDSYNRYISQLENCEKSAISYLVTACRHQNNGVPVSLSYDNCLKNLIESNKSLVNLGNKGIPSQFVNDYKEACKQYADVLDRANNCYHYIQIRSSIIVSSTNESGITSLSHITSNLQHHTQNVKQAFQNKK